MAAGSRRIIGAAVRLHGVRPWWVCVFTLFFALNLDQFGVVTGLGPQPKYWAIGIFLISLALFPANLNLYRLLRYPQTWWVSGYFISSAVWILRARDQESAWDGMNMVFTTALYVMTGLLTYPSMARDERLWGFTLWLALILGTTSIFIEYFLPGFFLFSEVGQGIVGRAAGLYLNPNFAAQTILMILSCLLIRSSPWGSLSATLLAFPALLLTFSRAGMAGWLLLVAVAAIRGRLPRFTLPALIGASAAIAVAGPMVLDAASMWIAPENRNSLDRLTWFLGQGNLNDHSAIEREWLLSFSWNEFLSSPLVGHGLGYMWVWPAEVGSHNMILRHLVEYGSLGLLIFPLFLCCSIWSVNETGVRKELLSVAAVTFMLGFFSHNMLEQGSFILLWLAMCLMPTAALGLPLQPLRRGVSGV